MAGAVLGLAALVVSLAAVNLLLRQAGYTTTLRYARMAVEHEATADSWRPMLQALDARDRGEPVYQTVFFTEHVKFQYPLTSLFLPMALRSPSRTGNALIKALNRVSLAVSAVSRRVHGRTVRRHVVRPAARLARLANLARVGHHRRGAVSCSIRCSCPTCSARFNRS